MALETYESTQKMALVKPEKNEMNRGAWNAEEDRKLAEAIKTHGAKRWTTIAAKAGLRRSGKSCRLRWMNYLRPNIKRGNISEQEEDLILRLHKLLGNRWSLIAGRLPGRTDNEIKNYWNSHLSKKVSQNKQQNAHAPSREGSKNQKRNITDECTNKTIEENISSGGHENSTVLYNVDDFFDFFKKDPFTLEWVSKFLELSDN